MEAKRFDLFVFSELIMVEIFGFYSVLLSVYTAFVWGISSPFSLLKPRFLSALSPFPCAQIVSIEIIYEKY
jgi:hypothetical protein